ncbi:hypothetical protein [Pseudomonas sp. dw_358]|uniref:hypothetical protein n=1 Tax=Pseudomonas sp. dw_358 TaxID=2720083 RepID=UPI001BD5AFE5|nr:hypothetical protein [Pseudomonas sp. dw_358]
MLESQLETMGPQVYERLIDRLGLALDVARTAVRLRDEVPVELELRGLSRAEYELINAYLKAGGADASPTAAAPVTRDAGPSGKVVWLEHVRARHQISAAPTRLKR